jgi:general stress protein 26
MPPSLIGPVMHDERIQQRVWQIIEHVHICMFVTHGRNGLRARPLDARIDRGGGLIYFLTDVRGTKDNEIANDQHVCMTFLDPKEKAYLSITGKAIVVKDAGLAKAYWKKGDEVWWPQGESDPNLLVVRVTPEFAELWDGPASSNVASLEFALARATGVKPNLGENRKVSVSMND